MSIPLAQLIRMTRFLLLCEMFEEVVELGRTTGGSWAGLQGD